MVRLWWRWHPGINAGKRQRKAADPPRTSSPGFDCDAQLSQRVVHPRSTCTAPQGKGHHMRCSKCPGGTNVREFRRSVFYWEERLGNPGRDGRQGRGGGRTPPSVCLPCSVYSASRPDKEAKSPGSGSALVWYWAATAGDRTPSRNNCCKEQGTQDTPTSSSSSGNYLQRLEALLGCPLLVVGVK